MSNKMWGGRFGTGPDRIMEEINASIGFDKRFFARGYPGLEGACGHVGRNRNYLKRRCR